MSYPKTKILPDGTVKEIHRVTVHTFMLGDVEDPDVSAGEYLYRWEKSEAGKYVMEKAVETPIWNRHFEVATYGWRFSIVADMLEDDYVYYTLKWK